MDFPILLLGSESCGKTLLLKCMQHYAARNGTIWDFGSIPRHGRSTIGADLASFLVPLANTDPKGRFERSTTMNDANHPTMSSKPVSSMTSRRFVVIRELGGQMSPLWPNYFDRESCRAMIYCIDATNPFQAARSAVDLARILRSSKLRENLRRLLIVFTKSADFESPETLTTMKRESTKSATSTSASTGNISIVELKNLMLLDEILDEARRDWLKGIEILEKSSAVTGVGVEEIFEWMERVASSAGEDASTVFFWRGDIS